MREVCIAKAWSLSNLFFLCHSSATAASQLCWIFYTQSEITSMSKLKFKKIVNTKIKQASELQMKHSKSRIFTHYVHTNWRFTSPVVLSLPDQPTWACSGHVKCKVPGQCLILNVMFYIWFDIGFKYVYFIMWNTWFWWQKFNQMVLCDLFWISARESHNSSMKE